MLRKLAVSLAVAGVLSATQANALGLGQIRIKSALNEPLDAEIQLVQVRDLDPQQIQPQMADMDQFAIAGLDRSRLLSNVRFQVDVRPNGTGVIHLTSSQPVREPFLNLLVEVNWPNGRLVREYTVLLDPPVFEAAPVAGTSLPVQAPVSLAPTQPARVQPAAPAPRRPSGPVDNIRTRATASQVFVETQDTLGQLARRHSPGGGTTLNQMMLALQRKNPHAFPNDNINFLKAGVVLELPTLEEVRAVAAADANREVARQMQNWRTGRSSAAAPAAPQTDGSKKKPVAPSESNAEATPESQAQLKILTAADPNGGEQAEEEAGAADTAKSEAGASEPSELLQRNEALENQLAVTQETVDRVERENAELNEKLTAITQQLETLQRLLELKDQQMAALQNQLQQVQETPAEPSPPAPAPKQPAGLIDTLMTSPAYMAGIGAVAGALLVGLMGLFRRRRDDAQPYSANLDEPRARSGSGTGSDSAAVAAAAVGAAAAAATMADDRDDVDEDTGQAARSAADPAEMAASPELDLDMDLDLDLPLDEAAADASAEEAADDEFDLSLEGAFEEEALPQDRVDEVTDAEDEFDLSFDSTQEDEDTNAEPQAEIDEDAFDDSLDDILGKAMGDEEEADRADLRSGMGQLEALDDLEDDEPDDTLESLGLDSVIAASDLAKEPEEEEVDFRPGGQVEAAGRSQDEEEDYRLSMVDRIEPEPDGEAAADAPDATAAEESEIVDSTAAAESEPEPEPEAPAFEFEDDEPATADGDEAFDIDAILAESGAELALEGDEPEAAAEDASPAGVAEPEIDEALATDEVPAEGLLPEAGDAASEAEPAADEGLSLHPELEALLSSDDDVEFAADLEEQVESVSLEEEASDDDGDLNDMLAALEKDFPDSEAADDFNEVEEELTANIAHDLEGDDSDLDSELEALLGSVDDEIALDESGAEDEDLGMDGLEFLDGTDEVETKLDLARAYIDMEDRDGAKDILSEILQEGSDKQQQEARKLMESLS